eukprot:scaffold2357_cov167-Amphora_coffeaeformis.AAC.23
MCQSGLYEIQNAKEGTCRKHVHGGARGTDYRQTVKRQRWCYSKGHKYPDRSGYFVVGSLFREGCSRDHAGGTLPGSTRGGCRPSSTEYYRAPFARRISTQSHAQDGKLIRREALGGIGGTAAGFIKRRRHGMLSGARHPSVWGLVTGGH